MKYVGSVWLSVFLLFSVGASAHHSSSAFDTSKEVLIKGTVTRWAWINPHVILQFDVKDEKGTVKTWAAEAGNPANMTRQGWARASFKPGDAITVTLLPSRNGEPAGILLNVVVDSTGQKFVTGAPPRVDSTGKPVLDSLPPQTQKPEAGREGR